MRRAVFLYNPQSGLARTRRRSDVERAAAVLKDEGITVDLEATAGPRLAGEQARKLVANGVDTVIACGGDGTVHDVLQGVAGTQACLGVLPLGTANSLGCDLGLTRDAERSARQLLAATTHRIAVGELEFQGKSSHRESRYFTVAAGIGADAALFYRINAGFKKRWGMVAYVGEALRQWVVQNFHPFRVEWFDSDRHEKRSEIVTQVLVVRIANFGGVLNRLAPGADLLRDDFRLVLFKTRSRARYLRFATGRLMGQSWTDPQIELVHATQMWCFPHRDDKTPRYPEIHAEADGEWLGRLPVSARILPSALNLLVPPTASCMTERVNNHGTQTSSLA
jgi:YegS/Rv2252/BmrU family lipid kinase